MRLQLDLQFFAEEKTEKATPKKKSDTRKKGQVAKSADLSSALSMLSIFILLTFAVPWMGRGLMDVMQHAYTEEMQHVLTEGNVHQLFTSLAVQSAKIVAPVLIVALVIGVFSNIVQIGFLFTTESLSFKLNRLDPISGIKRIYSLRAIVEFLKSLLKITLVGLTTFIILWMNRDQLLTLTQRTLWEAVVAIGKVTTEMGIAASIVLLVLGTFDYAYQRFDHAKNIRMSKKEIKDEYKNTEGDPQIKGRIRELQRQMAMRRMMQDVPKADVVITNPTHFAVALQYKDGEMDAPVVVAKGADLIAQRIKAIAKENKVAVVEKKEVARALYHRLEIGDQIPEEFFKAVAEILAYVYQLNGKV
ncbi:flagellar biosynthetic protein FlhB [Pullulanibacillus pueri]|uniref:Flagellar biosynthetic protein FlhB n=1 Tax=Pullulanibacillus pueri TaxID=1437324 RepID=A0A8J3EM84_9BACL|nr:flagellar biosynthesis protein FlhB [Pullulanibacillus pueri]MBM7682493.1 flagellar biosynthetic protein FlhB [Pullulanibacillus pueri]GGH82178.1 flagellar biosynthetic protein FlhB [Pullulanibacillus pueri]